MIWLYFLFFFIFLLISFSFLFGGLIFASGGRFDLIILYIYIFFPLVRLLLGLYGRRFYMKFEEVSESLFKSQEIFDNL